MKKINIILLIISFILLVTSAYAWYHTGVKSENVILVTGSKEIVAEMYLGNDTDKDGVLESIDTSSTGNNRFDILNNYYTKLDKKAITNHKDFIKDSALTFKVVIINQNLETDCSVDFRLASLLNYLNETMLNTSNIDHYKEFGNLDSIDLSYLANNSARLTFKLNDLDLNIYNLESSTSDLEQINYKTLVKSSSNSEVELISDINEANKTEFAIYEISNGESIVDDVVLGAKELLEIDFKLTYNLNTKGDVTYKNYLTNIYQDSLASSFTSNKEVLDYIDYYTKIESRFMIGDNLEFKFNIDYFEVIAVQLPNNGGIYDE